MSHRRKATFWKTYLVGPLWCKNGSKMAVDIIALGKAYDTIWYLTEDDYFFLIYRTLFYYGQENSRTGIFKTWNENKKKNCYFFLFDFEFPALEVPHS